MVVCFFNLRFGWSITGLIVPGYLVPLIILKPWSAAAIIIEAVFTYAVVKIFSEVGPKLNLWCSLFGRDSFFAILLVSVITRLLFDSYLFPEISSLLTKYTDIDFLYHGGLYSIGLVIVALTANQFWKNGLRKGMPEFSIILLVTFLLVKYILIKFTNFRLNEVAYLYESLATSIIASPKAYIILLTTAYIASRMNLTYGWEFGGIAIPALLALLWYYPFEILTSILEAVIIFAIASAILKMPLFANATIEGARKILLFFCTAFLYKLILGFVLPLFFTDIQTSDFYGFGYMLTSFIAIKMYDKQLGGRLIGATLITSGFSIIVATAIGYMLTFLASQSQEIQYQENYAEELSPVSTEKEGETEKLVPFVLNHMSGLYNPTGKIEPNSPKEITSFSAALGLLDNYLHKQTTKNFIEVSNALQAIQYNVKKLDDRYIVLYNHPTAPNKGIFIFSTATSLNYLAVVPYPARSPELTAATLSLLTSGKVRAVAIAGKTKNILEIDSFFNSYLFPFILHLQKNNKELFFFDNAILEEKDNSQTNYFWTAVKNKETLLNNLFAPDMEFNQYKELPYQFSGSRILKGQSAFFLSEDGISKILPPDFNKIEETYNSVLSINDIEKKIKVVDKPLSTAECKFFDTHVISKIIETTKRSDYIKKDDIKKELRSSKFSANLAGYELKLVKTSENSAPKYVELSPKLTGETRGVFYFKISQYAPVILETINPSQPVMELISFLTKTLNPQAIFFNNLGYENKNRTALRINSSSRKYKRSIFNMTRQATIREIDSILSGQNVKTAKSILTIVQVNQLAHSEKYSSKTVYISTNKGAAGYSGLTKTEKEIYNILKKSGFDVNFVNGHKNTTGLEANHSRYAAYLGETANSSFMILWLSPDVKLPIDLPPSNSTEGGK